MTTPIQLRPGGRAAYRYAARHPMVFVLIAIGAVALFAALRFLLVSGSFVPRVHVENRSEYAIDMRVTAKAHAGWMPIGTVQPNSSTTFEDVYDQGRTWVFHFSYGRFEESFVVSQRELETSGWRIAVPDVLVRQLHAAAVPRTPVFNGP